MAWWIEFIETTIKLYSGHLQVRAKSYEQNETSFAWEDLVEDPEQVAAEYLRWAR